MIRHIYGIGIAGVVTTLLSGALLGWVTRDWQVSANVSLTITAVQAVIFAVLYGIRSNWRASSVGKVMLILSGVMAVALIMVSLDSWFVWAHPWCEIVRYVTYSFAAIAYVPMLVTLYSEQSADRAANTGSASQ